MKHALARDVLTASTVLTMALAAPVLHASGGALPADAVTMYHDVAGWVDDWVATCPRHGEVRAAGPAAQATQVTAPGCELFLLVRDPIDLDEVLEDASAASARGGEGAAVGSDGADGEEADEDRLGDAPAPDLTLRLDESAPRRLLRLMLPAAGPEAAAAAAAHRLEHVVGGLEHGARLAALDVDLDGVSELLLVRHGKAHRLVQGERGARFEPWLEQPGAPPRGLVDALEPFDDVFAWAGVGSVSLYRLHPGDAAPQRIASVPLPVQASIGGPTLRLETPPIQRVRTIQATDPGDGPSRSAARWAIGPWEAGPLRWQVRLLELPPAGTEEATVETVGDTGAGEASTPGDGGGALPELVTYWLRTPENERPIGAEFFAIREKGDERGDEEVYVAAQALRADRVGILERKKVRLWRLADDRTRRGSTPLLAEATRSRIWQDLGVRAADVDRDGAVELLLLQREGFSGKELYAERLDPTSGHAVPGDSRMTKVSIKIEQPFADWTFVRDLTGDGIEDLVLQSRGLYLLPGLAADGRGRRGPYGVPLWSHGLPAARDQGMRVDFEDDGASGGPAETSGEGDWEEDDATGDAGGDHRGIAWGAARAVEGADGTVHLVVLGSVGGRGSGGGHRLYLLSLR
ncbi:MAG: hypothetical protein DWQ36_16775 [Acidobacteria bacterium]|nr:MAG: hypothetical protein DWQ36_16775 [Acidobacteriota bacterium]